MLHRMATLVLLAYGLPGLLLGEGVVLEVKSDPSQNIHVALSNPGEQAYFMLIGSLCNSLGTPAFGFVLKRNGQKDEPLVLSYNSVGVVCGNPDPWVVFLPFLARYEFTFFPSALRLQHHMQQSLTNLQNSSYTVEVTYSISLAQGRNLLTSHGLIPDKRWWQGHLTAILTHGI